MVKHKKIGFFALLALVCCALLFFGMQHYIKKKKERETAPQPGIALQRTENESLPLLSDLHGFVVWSSNRFGNHDIVMLSLPTQQLTRLTTNDHTEYFPRISPDGTKIIFCRSQSPWVSQRNQIPWDVYQLDLKTGQETLIARNGNVATWSENGEKIYFQRQGNQFVEYDCATRQETVLFESGKNLPFPASVILETPVWSGPRGELAVTLRGSRRATVLIDRRGKLRKVAGGCELNWAPDSSFLYQIDSGGRGGNTVYQVNPDTLQRKAWFDFPGPYSHEYFPKVANTGDFLVYGASTGEHEHDRADYEIFLWKIGSPPAEAVRLSYHTGNDCWPDVYLH